MEIIIENIRDEKFNYIGFLPSSQEHLDSFVNLSRLRIYLLFKKNNSNMHGLNQYINLDKFSNTLKSLEIIVLNNYYGSVEKNDESFSQAME